MNKKINFLKKYSLAFLYFIVYVLTLYSLTYFHLRAFIEGFIFTAPVVIFILIWACDICRNYEIKLKNFSQKKEANEDLFLIFFVLSISGLISMIYDKNNSDLLGWWPYIFLFQSVIFFVFSFLFTTCLQLLPKHKFYTQLWFLVILITQSISNYLPYYISLGIFGSFYKGYILMFIYLFLNLFIIGFLKKLFRNKH